MLHGRCALAPARKRGAQWAPPASIARGGGFGETAGLRAGALRFLPGYDRIQALHGLRQGRALGLPCGKNCGCVAAEECADVGKYLAPQAG